MSIEIHNMKKRVSTLENQMDDVNAGEADYKVVHKVAKAIACILIIGMDYFGIPAGYLIAFWFFSINPIAYVLEALMKKKHRHEVI